MSMGATVIDEHHPVVRHLLNQGATVYCSGRRAPAAGSERYSVLARFPTGDEKRGWGMTLSEALTDLARRLADGWRLVTPAQKKAALAGAAEKSER